METVLVFGNPIAGRGKGREVAARLSDRLRERYAVECFLDRPRSVGWRAGERAVRAVVVIGGDGTLREVAQWSIERAGGRGRLDWPLLIVPLGTANLMGMHLGIAWEEGRLVEQVMRAIDRRRVVEVDVAKVAGGICLGMVGVGFDAWVVRQLAELRKGPISKLDYVRLSLQSLASYEFPNLRVVADGQRVFDGRRAMVTVANIPEYGTGFSVLPLARSDDGMLDVCIMPCSTAGEMIKWFLATVAGEHLGREGVVYARARQVRIESEGPTAVQVDGEAAGQTPVDIDLLPIRIPFIVPEIAHGLR